MMRNTWRCVCCLLAALSVAVTAQSAPKDEKTPGEVADALAKGCKAKDLAPLRTFCRDWLAVSHPVPEAMVRKKPQFEQAVYALYPVFFSPRASTQESKYLIVQRKIAIHLVEWDLTGDYRAADPWGADLEFGAWQRPAISKFTVDDFRPALQIKGKNALYLDEQHLDAMLRFLTGEDERLLDSYWQEPNGFWENQGSTSDKNPEGRRAFLAKCLEVAPGHDGVGWHFETFPYIQLLLLDKDFKTAVILYRASFSTGGRALMQQSPQGWRVVDIKCSWQE